MADSTNTLKEREQLFVLEYLSDPRRDGKAAAIRAGYSPKAAKHTACSLLKRHAIRDLIAKGFETAANTTSTTIETVVEGILETIREAKQAGSGAWQMAAQQRGWELLGRYLGMFTERVEVGLDDRLMQQLVQGRRRAAGLPEPIETEDDDEAKAKEFFTNPKRQSQPN